MQLLGRPLSFLLAHFPLYILTCTVQQWHHRQQSEIRNYSYGLEARETTSAGETHRHCPKGTSSMMGTISLPLRYSSLVLYRDYAPSSCRGRNRLRVSRGKSFISFLYRSRHTIGRSRSNSQPAIVSFAYPTTFLQEVPFGAYVIQPCEDLKSRLSRALLYPREQDHAKVHEDMFEEKFLKVHIL